MGLSCWTITKIFFFAFLHLNACKAVQSKFIPKKNNDEDLHPPLPSGDYLFRTEDSLESSTLWTQNKEVEDGLVSQGPTPNEHTTDSNQLIKTLLKHYHKTEYIPVQAPVTNFQQAEILKKIFEELQTELTFSQWPSSGWVETPSHVSPTGLHFTLVPNQESPLNMNTASSYPVKEDYSTFPTSVLYSHSPTDLASSKHSLQFVWTSTKQTANGMQLLEKTNELTPTVKPTHADVLDKIQTTRLSHVVISEATQPTILTLSNISTEASETQMDLLSEETSILPFSAAENTLGPVLGSQSSIAISSFLDCSENCDFSIPLSPAPSNEVPNLYRHSSVLPSPPVFITLHSDWNTSVADWGVAWEALVYGSVGFFGSVTLLSLLSLFCLIFRCPSGGHYLAVLHLLLIFVGSSRAFALFYDAYGHQDRLPIFIAILLHELAYPCMTTSFSIVFHLISSRCLINYSTSNVLRLSILSASAFIYFVVSAGAVVLIDFLQKFAFLLLVSHGVYIVLTVLLSLSFFIFCCLTHMQCTQMYDLKNSAPPIEYSSVYPFANSKDFSRASHIIIVSAFFGLLNAVLQLYAMLYAMGYGGSVVFGPWLWWTFQLSSSLCEVGACLPLAVVGAYPLFSSNEIGRDNCWTKIFCFSPGQVTIKAPILQTNSQWSSSQHEKLLMCDTIIRSDSEFFPLYTLVEKRLSLGEDISLIYNSSKSLEVQGLSLHNGSKTPSFISVQMDSDSTVDFQPPSPINLRRSIDEALFSESLIPKSLFHGTTLSSSLSLTVKSTSQLEDCVFKEKASDRGLYRTSSCMEMDTSLPAVKPSPNTYIQENISPCSSQIWRDRESTTSSVYKISQDGLSLLLCTSSDNVGSSYKKNQDYSHCSKSEYHSLLSPSQESLDITTKSESMLRDDFKDVFGPIDALSVSSDTIDL
ncbi:hypothetical protein GDO86_006051 [Hymenochirus boettgeri]|uniref:Proline-rich transmembrane protein 3/4 domain-containing protein n=1 Tax=Hymenochirus boettgeri TaxID=247094 RepID=A0A8T2J6Z2_9PIPI|nr:hypothetical protein GDO86_006051 [Hymenochirus boettgeri]